MKRLTLILLMVFLPLYSTLAQDRGGGQGTPIYLDVTITFTRNTLPDMNCITNALSTSGWGLISQTVTRDTVTMRWVDYLLGVPNLSGAQQGLIACEHHVDIRANVSGVLLP